MMKFNRCGIAVLLCLALPGFGQVNTALFRKLLDSRTHRVLYWQDTLQIFMKDTGAVSRPVRFTVNRPGAPEERRYRLLVSGLVTLQFRSYYLLADTAVYYRVADSSLAGAAVRLYLPDRSQVRYTDNRQPPAPTAEAAAMVRRSIRAFEADLQQYYRLRMQEAQYRDNILPLVLITAGMGGLAYFGFASDAVGFKGALHKGGGAVSAFMSLSGIYRSISEWIHHTKRRQAIQMQENKLRALNY